MVQMTARMKEPKAREPKLYLTDHQNPFSKLKLPRESAVLVKYQVQTPTINA